MKKNIVILSTMYYPDMGAPSACLDKYVQCLKDKYNFSVITKTYVYGATGDGKRLRYITNWTHKLSLKCNHNIENSKYVCLSKLGLLLINIYKLIVNQFAYPYFNSWEIGEYYNHLNKLSKEIHVDIVISVANTWTCQFAVLKYKQKNPSVKWISFVFDPFSEHYIYYKYKMFKKSWKGRNLKNERLIYDTADVLLFSDEMFKYATNTLGISTRKAFNLGFVLDDIRKGESPYKINSNGLVKLIYAGMLYQKIRNPEFMLSTISQVEGVELDLFVGRGECENILDTYISDKIRRTGFVNRDRYEQMICNEYDVLINVGNISTLQAPSKMLELLSTGRPILNFYYVKDSQYWMIEQYPLGLNIGFNEENAVRKVSKFCQNMKGKCLSYSEVLQLYPDYVLSRKISFLESLIES